MRQSSVPGYPRKQESQQPGPQLFTVAGYDADATPEQWKKSIEKINCDTIPPNGSISSAQLLFGSAIIYLDFGMNTDMTRPKSLRSWVRIPPTLIATR